MKTTITLLAALILTGLCLSATLCMGPLFKPSTSTSTAHVIPHGTVVFTRETDGNRALWLLRLDTLECQALTVTPAWDEHPSWATDGSFVAFSSTRAGGASDIWIWEPAGTTGMVLDPQATHEDTHPAVSTDANQILFIRKSSGEVWRDVWVMEASGNSPRRLPHDGNDHAWPTWEDNSHFLCAWYGPRDSGQEHGELQRNSIIAPAWEALSPDNPYSPYHVTDTHPRVSADGARVVFASNRNAAVNGDTSDIWIMHSDGASPYAAVTDPFNNADPCWAREDTRIVFSSNRDGTQHLWMVQPDGEGLTRLTDDVAADTHPDWIAPVIWP